MAKICIVTDSTADIPKKWAEEWDIYVIPLKVHMDEETFLDGLTITSESFFEKLVCSNHFPTTSQPSPAEFERTYREIASVKGKDVQIISIHLASALSGTYQSAFLAKTMVGDLDITVIDSKKAAFMLGMIVQRVAKAAKSGKDKEQCIDLIQNMIQNQKEYFVIDTLTYLHKGGRIGKAQALFGSLLNVKPILSLNEQGEVYPFDKVRGKKKAVTRMLEALHEQMKEERVLCSIVYALNREEAEQLSQRISDQFNVEEMYIVEAGPVIGAHIGPQALAVCMYKL